MQTEKTDSPIDIGPMTKEEAQRFLQIRGLSWEVRRALLERATSKD